MYLYHLSDDQGWYSPYVYKNLRDAREAALKFMDKPAWNSAMCITIHRIDTRKESIDHVEYVYHGVHRAEAHEVLVI